MRMVGASSVTFPPLPCRRSACPFGSSCGAYQPCSFVPSAAVKFASSTKTSVWTHSPAGYLFGWNRLRRSQPGALPPEIAPQPEKAASMATTTQDSAGSFMEEDWDTENTDNTAGRKGREG